MSNLISDLFETKALKVSPYDQPFWYTSGKIGFYYINTHFLYGSENEAIALLDFIDSEKVNKETLPNKIYSQAKKQYNENIIF